jgi:PAS domain S-box-containing protein
MASVVVAEDNVEHQRVIAEVVRRLGHQVTVAADGRAGLAAVARQHPDLVVADVDMPQLDGLQMCRAMRADPALAGIPVVLITAYLPPGDPQLCAAGAAALVRKPFAVQELTDTLRAHLDGHSPAAADPAVFMDALLDSLDVGVAVCDAGGRLVVFNRAMGEFFGEGGDAVPVRDWPRRFGLRRHDGSPMAVDELPLLRALAGERVERADVLAYDRRDRPHWLVVNARPLRDPAGTGMGALVAVHDVTAEHRARQYEGCKTEVLKALAQAPDTAVAASEVLRAIATTLDWPYLRLWLVDEVADVLRPVATWTAPGERPLPIPATLARGAGLAGRAWDRGDLVWVPDIHAEDSPVLAMVAAGSPFRAAAAVPVRRGERVTGVLAIFSHAYLGPDPALAVLLTGIAGNIGAYLEQRRADELTRHLAASTDEYIALVGHELRTPLTSISAYTDLIAESPDDTPLGELRELLQVVARNNHRLRTLVEQLLDLAALESGQADLHVAAVDLAAVVAAAVAAGAAAAEAQGITMGADLPGPLGIPGDPDRLRQVVDSLISNAVKYSPPGSEVTVALAADDDVATLTVADAGIGVPDDDQPHLFRRLFRGSNARHSGVPGTGLGLALSRAVVERHRGTITLSARRPAGTVVTVRLPRADG